MRMLGFSHLYYPSIGGNQNHMRELSKRFAAMGNQVTVFTSQAKSVTHIQPDFSSTLILKKKEVVDGVVIRRFPICRKLYHFLFRFLARIFVGHKIVMHFFQDALTSLAMGPFCPGMVLRAGILKPDVVYMMNMYNAHSYFAYLTKKFFGVPLITIASTRFDLKQTYGLQVKKILQASDSIIALTDYERKGLIKLGVQENKIQVIGCGIDPIAFENANPQRFRKEYNLSDVPIALFLGRKIDGKGIDSLIDAMKSVWLDVPDAVLLLVGKERDAYAEIIKHKINAIDLDNRSKVIQINEFDQEIKADIYAACDIFVMPSNIDTFGIVYLEAWISGKPIVACKNTAPASFMEEGIDCLLVEYGNQKQLAKAIAELLKDKQQAYKLGQNGKEKALKYFTWDIISNNFLKEAAKVVNS